MNKFRVDVLEKGYFLILLLPFILFWLITKLAFIPMTDEHLFHLPAINAFASSFPFFNLKDYPSASGPLPYILWTIFGKIFGFEIWKLRTFTMILSYLSSLIFFITLREQKKPSPLLTTLVLIFFPYIFLHSFTIYTSNLTLLWELFSLRYFLKYQDSKSNLDLLMGSVGSLALVFSRQLDVALPAGVLCYFLLKKSRRTALSVASAAAPIAGLLLLTILWNGITPPTFQSGFRPVLKPIHLTLVLTVVGFYFQPLGLYEAKQLKARSAFILLLIPFLLVFSVPYPNEGLGIVYYGIDWLARGYSNLSWMLSLYLGMLGGLVFHAVVRQIREARGLPLPFCVLLFYLFLNLLNPFVYERHYYFVWPLLLLLLPRELFEKRFLFIFVFAIHLGISICYVILSLVFPK